MNQLFTKRPLLKTGILGLLMLPLIIMIGVFSPPESKIPEGYSSSILAFEFVGNNSDVKEVLGNLDDKELRDLDRLNYVDFGFMILYGIFLFLVMARLGTIVKSNFLKKMKWIVPIVVIADALENIQLLKISNQYSEGITDHIETIKLLSFFTWTKWGLLAVLFLIIGIVMIRMNKSKWLGYVLFIPIVLCIGSLMINERWISDLFATSIFGVFFLILVYCFVYTLDKSKESKNSQPNALSEAKTNLD